MSETLSSIIGRKELCKLCDECKLPVSTIGERAAILYKTGEDLAIDWFLTLQRNVNSNPEKGFGLMIMPLGHLESFAQMHTSNRKLAQNYGLVDALANYAMQVVRKEGSVNPSLFLPSAVIYGKCSTDLNTQTHIHRKVYTFDGSVAQAFPSDSDWLKETPKPVLKQELAEERYHYLAARFIEICSDER